MVNSWGWDTEETCNDFKGDLSAEVNTSKTLQLLAAETKHEQQLTLTPQKRSTMGGTSLNANTGGSPGLGLAGRMSSTRSRVRDPKPLGQAHTILALSWTLTCAASDPQEQTACGSPFRTGP